MCLAGRDTRRVGKTNFIAIATSIALVGHGPTLVQASGDPLDRHPGFDGLDNQGRGYAVTNLPKLRIEIRS